MNKTSKIVLSFVLCLSIVFYFPVSSKASGLTLECKTITSVDGYYSNADIQLMQKRLTGYNPSLANRSISDIETALSSFVPLGGDWSKYFITYWPSEDFILVEEFDSSKIHEGIFLCANNDSLPASNVDLNNRAVNAKLNVQVLFGGEYRRESTFNFSNNSWSSSYSTTSPTFINALIQPTLYIDGNVPMYCKWDIIESGGTYSDDLTFYLSDKSAYTNFLSRDLPYETSSGSVVDPSPEVLYEGNNNHMYFKDCDLGFCEPTGITNFISFGGAYLYCKYSLDNWIVNHINEYQLQFNVVAAIGSEQNNFSYTMRLDRNGFVTVPFSSLFVSNSPSAIPINRGFAAVVSSDKLGTDYNIAHLYSVANSNVPNFVSDVLDAEYDYNLTDLGWSALKGGALKYIVAWVDDSGTISMNNTANWAENVAQSFNPYILRIEVKLISGSDQSSGYAEKFDLYTGDQSVVDTGGLVNPDPFIPDVDQGDGDLPSPPQDPNSTSPGYNIVPSGYWQGTMNAVIGYDPGYRDLKADLDKDPDGNFTQYLVPFKNNEVGGFVGDFLDDMPTALKTIFVGGFGVLTLLGIYRFIRRG